MVQDGCRVWLGVVAVRIAFIGHRGRFEVLQT